MKMSQKEGKCALGMLKQIENGRLKASNEIKETFEKDNLSDAKAICNKYCV